MFNPVAFKIGPLAIRWYGLSYAAGALLAVPILRALNKKRPAFPDDETLLDLIFWIFLLGVIAGGRLGYVLFYNLPYFAAHPLRIFAVWEGGMSFHGGLIGSILVAFLFCRRRGISFLKAADLFVIPGALAQGLGRIANFLNGELPGRVITSPMWRFLGADFGDGLLRWPSPLFQSAEAFISALLLFFLFRRTPQTGALFFAYLALNGGFRFFSEFLRAPDPQIGFIGPFTLGQLLSAAVAAAGILLYIRSTVLMPRSVSDTPSRV